MSAVLITTGHLAADGSEALQKYASSVLPMLLAAGGQMLFRGGPMETLVGNNPPDLFFAMRFESAEIIRRLLTSEEYVRLVPYRNRAFSQITTVIAQDFES